MTEIIGIRFKNVGKVYYFDPDGQKYAKGEHAVVETVRGIELGEVVVPNKEVEDDSIVQPLKKVIRRADEDDLKTVEANRRKEKEAFAICQKKIADHKLEMKLIDVEYTFDNNKILFYFTADGRVDFRELVKDLASVFRTRIELRQIGVRDEAKMLGGLGICGNPFCCASFLGEFLPVSIKMAKEQGLSLNPTKISGSCGRLMCCLRYEQEAYEDLLRTTPRVDAVVETPDGVGTVVDVSLLSGYLKVRLDGGDAVPKVYHRDDVQVKSGGGRAAAVETSAEEEEAFNAALAEEGLAPETEKGGDRPQRQRPRTPNRGRGRRQGPGTQNNRNNNNNNQERGAKKPEPPEKPAE